MIRAASPTLFPDVHLRTANAFYALVQKPNYDGHISIMTKLKWGLVYLHHTRLACVAAPPLQPHTHSPQAHPATTTNSKHMYAFRVMMMQAQAAHRLNTGGNDAFPEA